MERYLGQIDHGLPGPTMVCVGGLHGNEPAGVLALERVVDALDGPHAVLKGKLHGRLLAMRGNLEAIRRGRRFIDEDLNRIWDPEHVQRVVRSHPSELTTSEMNEMRVLYRAIQDEVERDAERIYFADLHTTSSHSLPFMWSIPDASDGHFARNYPMPVIYDLVPRIQGSSAAYFGHLGHTVICAEGGQHEAAASVDYLEAVMWVSLVQAGLLKHTDAQEIYTRAYRLLDEATRAIPRVMEIFYHHKIKLSDDFMMKPGYLNFQEVEAGEVLARDVNGEIRSPANARILMPLYQAQGEDGFLLVRERRTDEARMTG